MHTNNGKFLDEIKATYPNYFKDSRVLDLGSCGSSFSRKYFDGGEYVGIDVVSGEGVDIQVNAKETSFDVKSFDVLLSLSMLEHDPTWQLSLARNLTWLKKGGMIFLCWGAEGNAHHDSGPFPWKIIPHMEVVNFLKEMSVEVIDSFFEWDRYGQDECSGAYDVIARKGIKDA